MMFTHKIRGFFFLLISSALPLSLPAAILFQDDFSAGSLVKSNSGVGWRSSNTSVNDQLEVVSNSPNGTHALKFTFSGDLNIADDSWAEQRFDLGGQYPEIWIKYNLYIPVNYYHRYDVTLTLTEVVGVFNEGNQIQVVGREEYALVHKISGNTMVIRALSAGRFSFSNAARIIDSVTGATALISGRTGMADNNKGLLQMWSGGYGTASATQYLGFESWVNQNGNSEISRNTAVDKGNYRPGHVFTGALLVDRAKDLGKWIEWIIQLKVASSANNDGIARVWKDGVLVINHDNIPNYSSLGNNFYEKGYLLGWANSGFDENTSMYIDNVVFSTTPLGTLVPERPSVFSVK